MSAGVSPYHILLLYFSLFFSLFLSLHVYTYTFASVYLSISLSFSMLSLRYRIPLFPTIVPLLVPLLALTIVISRVNWLLWNTLRAAQTIFRKIRLKASDSRTTCFKLPDGRPGRFSNYNFSLTKVALSKVFYKWLITGTENETGYIRAYWMRMRARTSVYINNRSTGKID